MRHTNIIAIDCGASFTKCALFENEKIIWHKSVASPSVNEGIFCVERIESLISIVEGLLNEAFDRVNEATIVIDNEMHGFILAKEDGSPYTGYISWQKEYITTEEVLQTLSEMGVTNDCIERTGMPIRSGLPSSTLLWMGKHDCFVKETLYFYTLGDYIIRRLTGEEPICHPTNAAATGLFNLETGDWNSFYISKIVGGASIVFPQIGVSGYRNLKGQKSFEFLPAIGDQQAALLGSGFKSVNEISINIGTGGQVSRLVKNGLVYGDYQIRPYFYGYHIKTIPHIPSGRALNVFFRFTKDLCTRVNPNISDNEVWEIIKESVSRSDIEEKGMSPNRLESDLSFFENAITNDKVGKICNITEYGFTFKNLMTSVFRQMAENYIEMVLKVNEGMPDYDTVLFSGGISNRWEILRYLIVHGLKGPEEKLNVMVSDHDALYGCYKYALLFQKY